MGKRYVDVLMIDMFDDNHQLKKVSILKGALCLKYHKCFTDREDESTYCPMYNPAVGCLWGRLQDAVQKIDIDKMLND